MRLSRRILILVLSLLGLLGFLVVPQAFAKTSSVAGSIRTKNVVPVTVLDSQSDPNKNPNPGSWTVSVLLTGVVDDQGNVTATPSVLNMEEDPMSNVSWDPDWCVWNITTPSGCYAYVYHNFPDGEQGGTEIVIYWDFAISALNAQVAV